MPLKPKCAELVQRAARELGHSKDLPDAKLDAIDSRLRSTMRYLARTDPNWQGKSPDQRTLEAAKQAMEDIKREADRKVANANLQVVKSAAADARIGSAQGDTRSASLVHDIDRTGDYITGVKHGFLANLMDLLDAVKSRQGASLGRKVAMFLFDVQNPGMTVDLAREIFASGDGHTGNKIAQAGAKAWLETVEKMRNRFNSAGGDVGKLDYGYLPQPHDANRVRSAGMEAWVNKILPSLDRARMIDEAGVPLDDAAAREVLGKIWETISSEGLNKQEVGEFKGSGARANSGSDARELHFKSAEGYLSYLNEFGRGSMYDAMIGHVGKLSRDIGLVERYGPNPNSFMNLEFQKAAKADKRNIGDLPRSFGSRPQSYWDIVNGTASVPQSARFAQIGTDVRNIQTFKLGGAVISSITDLGNYFVSVGYNKLPYWDAFKNIGKSAASGETKRFLTSHGIIAESMAGDLNRWTNDNIKANWSGRLANSTLRLSLLNAWTDSIRRAFSLTMMQGIARMAGKDWDALTQWDRFLMERKGVTADDWAVIRKGELTNFNGVDHLTPEGILASKDPKATEVLTKYLGLIQDESEFAVLNPDLATRVIVTGGASQRGTIRGELARSVMQFKSFPLAMISRHWNRMLDAPKVTDGSAPWLANRVVYAGAMMVSATAFGAIAYQVKQIFSGKDPVDMTGPHAGKFWAKAAAQGGGLSIVGDMLLNDPGNSVSDTIRSTTGTIVGPSISTAVQAVAIPAENAWAKAKGNKTHLAAQSIGLARQNMPLVNIWYVKSAIDHAGMHALQENLSPGYLGRMQQQAAKDWGQRYWWKPGTGGPQRAPDFGRAIGEY